MYNDYFFPMGARWEKNRKNLLQKNEVLPKLNEIISDLKKHIYRKCEQVSGYKKKKDDLKPEEVLIHVDYSESYSNAQQNFSLFTSCSYYCEKEHADLVEVSMSVIGESSEHSRIAASTCVVLWKFDWTSMTLKWGPPREGSDGWCWWNHQT